MTAVIDEATQYVDDSGAPLVNGKIYFGTQNADPVLNPISIFSDRALTTAISNPQTLDSQGRSTNKVWLSGRYSLRIEDLNAVQIYEELDNGDVEDTGATILENVSGANTITATAESTISSYDNLNLFIFTAAQINTGNVTLNIDGVGAKSVLKNHDQELNPGDLEEDQVVLVSFNLSDDTFEVLNQNVKTVQFNEATGVAAATTTDIWDAGGNTLHITGTTGPITSFGTAPNVGARKTLIFDGVVTITFSTDVNLQGGADYTTEAGDILHVYADTVTQFDIEISPISGLTIIAVDPAFENALLHITDEKTSGTPGGTFTSGADRTRDLTTVETNEISGAALSSNQITGMTAGDYFIMASAPGFKVAAHRAQLYDVTGAATLIVGTSANTASGDAVTTVSSIIGRFTLSVTSVLEIRHTCTTTRATDGFGENASLSFVEIYTEVLIWKVS